MGKEIKRIFIANRGEIAVRIIHTCKEMNIETVVAYCPADRGSLFTLIADYVHEFDTNELYETYLNSEVMISLAKNYSCDAIHPGYGFLSENAHFADQCSKENIIFIGPDSKTISLMGDKISARQKVQSLGISLLPSIKLSQSLDFDKIKKKLVFLFLLKLQPVAVEEECESFIKKKIWNQVFLPLNEKPKMPLEMIQYT